MKKFFKIIFAGEMLFTLVACGVPESQKVLDSYLGSIKSGKIMENETDQQTKVLGKIFQKMEYKIIKTTETGDTAKIEVQIKAVNLAAYMADYMGKMMPLAFSGMSDKAIEATSIKYFDDLAKSKDLSYIEETVTACLSKKNGKWQIDNTEEIGNVISGNVATMFEE